MWVKNSQFAQNRTKPKIRTYETRNKDTGSATITDFNVFIYCITDFLLTWFEILMESYKSI